MVFAFETTRQPLALVPLVGGTSVACFVSLMLMRHSIMTKRIAAAIHVPTELGPHGPPASAADGQET